jgi:hypothetical protein
MWTLQCTVVGEEIVAYTMIQAPPVINAKTGLDLLISLGMYKFNLHIISVTTYFLAVVHRLRLQKPNLKRNSSTQLETKRRYIY